MEDGIGVIMRFHDPARLDELSRAVFSAALQDVAPVAIHVVCQRFTAAVLDSVRAALAPVMAIVPDARLQVLNRPDPAPLDARAALMNAGLRAVASRYVAFLDYDDLIYPEAYRLLIAELQTSGAAIAFGGIINTDVSRDGVVPVTLGKRRIFQGEGLRQLLHSNFCPLHSFVVDRSRVDAADLVVDETLRTLEDYDLLLRLCARYPASFHLKDKIVGEYLFKNDGSNVNPLTGAKTEAEWARSTAVLDARKQDLVLSPAVQATLGIDCPGMTVAGLLGQ